MKKILLLSFATLLFYKCKKSENPNPEKNPLLEAFEMVYTRLDEVYTVSHNIFYDKSTGRVSKITRKAKYNNQPGLEYFYTYTLEYGVNNLLSKININYLDRDQVESTAPPILFSYVGEKVKSYTDRDGTQSFEYDNSGNLVSNLVDGLKIDYQYTNHLLKSQSTQFGQIEYLFSTFKNPLKNMAPAVALFIGPDFYASYMRGRAPVFLQASYLSQIGVYKYTVLESKENYPSKIKFEVVNVTDLTTYTVNYTYGD